MNDKERQIISTSLENWKEVDKVQNQLRRQNLRRTKVPDAIAAFDLAFRAAVAKPAKRTASGLVDFYKRLGITAR